VGGGRCAVAMCDRVGCAMQCAVVVRDAMRDAIRGPWAVGERDAHVGEDTGLRTGSASAMRDRAGCAMRCAVVVRDAMRGPLRTGCICAMRCAV